MGAYVPGGLVGEGERGRIVEFLQNNTTLSEAYVAPIASGRLPGRVETNAEGWIDQPWYQAWLERLPEKKREEPFGGAIERRRVPLDPESLRSAIRPHPMLSSDAETLAGGIALAKAGIDRLEIDQLLVNSLVPDRALPTNAPLVQYKLGLKNAASYYIDTCCASFVTMLEMAMTYVRAGMRKKVLIIASSLDSHINDKSTYYSPNTGDAAIAAVVGEVDEGFGFLGSASAADGSRHAAIVFKNRPPELSSRSTSGPSYAQEYVTFNDAKLVKAIAATAGEDLGRVIYRALDNAQLGVPQLDFMVTHQPVAWAADCWRQSVGVAPEKFHCSFERYGNVACASAGINLWEAISLGKIKAGDRVLCASSGAGEHWMAVVHRIPAELIGRVCP